MVSLFTCMLPWSLTVITRIVIWRVECHWERGRNAPVTAITPISAISAITAVTAITAVAAVTAVAMAADYEYPKRASAFLEVALLNPSFVLISMLLVNAAT